MAKTIASLFYWLKKKPQQTLSQKVTELMPVLIEMLPKVREAMRRGDDGEVRHAVGSDGQIIGQMYDFAQTYDGLIYIANDVQGGYGRGQMPWGTDQAVLPPDPHDGGVLNEADLIKEGRRKDTRVEAKPKDVEVELDKIPTPWNTKDKELDAKIALLNDKTKLVNQRFVNAQIDGMCKRLQNRKHYHEEHDFYERFQNTNDEKIDQLLKKYKLEVHKSELFVPSFPKEAIDVMTEYTEVTQRLTKEKPVFYVIAEHEDFEKKRKVNDPILLVQSPFGFYWQVLGAWDKEMILLSEL